MYEKEKKDLQRLDKLDRLLVVSYWYWLLVKQTYKRQSLPMRLVPLHAVFMLVIIIGFPGSFPLSILAPVAFIAAYYAALVLLFILPSRPRSPLPRDVCPEGVEGKVREHWVK